MGAAESTDLAVTEKPQQLLTIEPKQYVALVFEPFSKQFEEAKNAVRDVAYDISTTAGMNTAIKWRAMFRDIRVAAEKARKLRKAPILEIGKLLDSRHGDIEATLLPLETMFDEDIKAEEGRKETEKARKATEESARISKVTAQINAFRTIPADYATKSSVEIEAAIARLTVLPVTIEDFFEYTGEGQQTRDEAIAKLEELAAAAREREAESARLAEERAAFEREQAAAAERDRVAAAERAEQERVAQAERDRVAAVQREEQERATTLLREQQAEHARQVAAQQSEFDRKQAEIDRQHAELVAAQEAQAQTARDEQARKDAEEQARLDAIAAEARRVEEAEAARVQAEKDAAASAGLAEAARQQEEREAREAEERRREQVQFVINGPGDVAMVRVIAAQFEVTVGDAMQWFKKFDYDAADEQFAAENGTEKAA